MWPCVHHRCVCAIERPRRDEHDAPDEELGEVVSVVLMDADQPAADVECCVHRDTERGERRDGGACCPRRRTNLVRIPIHRPSGPRCHGEKERNADDAEGDIQREIGFSVRQRGAAPECATNQPGQADRTDHEQQVLRAVLEEAANAQTSSCTTASTENPPGEQCDQTDRRRQGQQTDDHFNHTPHSYNGQGTPVISHSPPIRSSRIVRSSLHELRSNSPVGVSIAIRTCARFPLVSERSRSTRAAGSTHARSRSPALHSVFADKKSAARSLSPSITACTYCWTTPDGVAGSSTAGSRSAATTPATTSNATTTSPTTRPVRRDVTAGEVVGGVAVAMR